MSIGTIDRPIDVLVDHVLEVIELALVDRAVQRARKTPEAVLCHSVLSQNWIAKQQPAISGAIIGDARRGCCTHYLKLQIMGTRAECNAQFCIAQMRQFPSRERHSGARVKRANYDVQLHIGKSRDSPMRNCASEVWCLRTIPEMTLRVRSRRAGNRIAVMRLSLRIAT
jgi:hypothetical protein